MISPSRVGLIFFTGLVSLACGGSWWSNSGNREFRPLAPSDPTPLSKCQVTANALNPLVTEWPASEKAHLQSVASRGPVAVEFSGCDLRIIDACQLPGRYSWQRTTLATDITEIDNADELYAKLPIGAISLEGELGRSGRLAVKTRVAGQLKAESVQVRAVPPSSPCSRATHFIDAISVGTFKLLSGARVDGAGGIKAPIVGGGMKVSRGESVLREAGLPQTCIETTDQAPHPQCASPIQVFLTPLWTEEALGREAAARRVGAVHIQFAAAEEPDEIWTLRAKTGDPLCALPCTYSVPPASGFYLQREKANGYDLAAVDLPSGFPFRPGTPVYARYQAERGNPTLSSLTFWFVGIPSAILGTLLLTAGTVQATSGTDCEQSDCFPFPSAGMNIGFSLFYLSIAGGSLWWSLYSQQEEIELSATPPSSKSTREVPWIGLGPAGITGIF